MTMLFYGICEATLTEREEMSRCNVRVTRNLTAGEHGIDRCDQHS